MGLLAAEDEHLRVWGIRLLADAWPIDGPLGPIHPVKEVDGVLLDRLVEMARGDASGLVRRTLASTLQRLPLAKRAMLGGALAGRKEDGDDRDQPSMVWYGLGALGDHDPMGLVDVAAEHIP